MSANYARRWKTEEINILTKAYETCRGISRLPERLGRSRSAIISKAFKLGLTPPTRNPYYVLHSYFFRAMAGGKNYDGSSSLAKIKRWEAHGLELKKVRLKNCVHLMIDMEKFWPWAEQHPHLVNFKDLKPMDLGPEPAWVAKKRQQDYDSRRRRNWCRWTESEYASLIHYITKLELKGIALEEKTGRSLNSINIILRKHGSKMRVSGKDYGVYWRNGRDKKMRELVIVGKDWLEISAAMDCDIEIIKRHCRDKYRSMDLPKLREKFQADKERKVQLSRAVATLRKKAKQKAKNRGKRNG